MAHSPTHNIAEDLRQSQQRIQSILGSITGCFFVLDQEWRFLHVNFPNEGYLHCPREDLYRKTLWEAYPHWEGTECNQLLNRSLLDKATVHFEFFDKTNSRWYEMYSFPMPEGISIHFHDISERKAVEDRLKHAHEELEQRIEERTRDLVQSNQALQSEILERKKAEKEVLEITQEEQRRFGSQLHDGLCQELTAILVFAKGITQKMEREKSLDIAELKKISDLLRGAVDQARDTARGLYPGDLEGSSLMNALEEMTANAQSASGIPCQFQCPSPIHINDNRVATHLYKIAQEGVSNAISHAKAKGIVVSLKKTSDVLTLDIQDDGVGSILDSKNLKGIGLKIIQYRADLIGASFQILPNSPHGIILKCELKLP